eukprot:gene6357-11792_t
MFADSVPSTVLPRANIPEEQRMGNMLRTCQHPVPTSLVNIGYNVGIHVSDARIAETFSHYGLSLLSESSLEGLVLGFGLSSGIAEVEVLCTFACLAIITSITSFFILLPAVTSIFIQLNENSSDSEKDNTEVTNQDERITYKRFLSSENEATGYRSNPLANHLRFIMCVGLFIVHVVNLSWHVVHRNRESSEKLHWLSLEQLFALSLVANFAFKYLLHELRESIETSAAGRRVRTISSSNTPVTESPAVAQQPPSRELNMMEKKGIEHLSDDEIVSLIESKQIAMHSLETVLKSFDRAVELRRTVIGRRLRGNAPSLNNLPWETMDYSKVHGVCCENVIGFCPVPVGFVGPLLLDKKQYHVPMATTEGCLVASTNRGCSALRSAGGVSSFLLGDGMTRGPVVRFHSAKEASELKHWLDMPENYSRVEEAFNVSSRYTELKSVKCTVAGRLVFLRFRAISGDAMGMNMVSKGTDNVLRYLQIKFSNMEIISVSGNYCTDKKPSAINWIDGRGKYVVCEAVIPGSVVKKVLKTTVESISTVNVSKNLVGSAMAGSIGGQNAHAANIVAAIYIATGQMMGIRGCGDVVGENASTLAKIVCGTVLAGELSLLSALAAGHLVKSHMKFNRANGMSSSAKCPTV